MLSIDNHSWNIVVFSPFLIRLIFEPLDLSPEQSVTKEIFRNRISH